MKIVFEYYFGDGCYGITDFSGKRTEEAELKDFCEVTLSPCSKAVKVNMEDCRTALVEFPCGGKLRVGTEKTPFDYEESYESFGDLRYCEIHGVVVLKEE